MPPPPNYHPAALLSGRLAQSEIFDIWLDTQLARQTGGIKLKLIVGLKNNSDDELMYFINVSILIYDSFG